METYAVDMSDRKRGTAAQKVDRDARLVADRARGLGWAALAAKYGITARQAQNIWKGRPQPAPTGSDPLAEVLELLESLAIAAEDLAELAESTGNDSIRIGAIKSRVDMQLRRFELMRQYGLAPWGQSEAEVMEALGVVLGVLSQAELSEELRRQLAAALASVHPHQSQWLRRAVQPASLALAAEDPKDSTPPEAGDSTDDPPALRSIR